MINGEVIAVYIYMQLTKLYAYSLSFPFSSSIAILLEDPLKSEISIILSAVILGIVGFIFLIMACIGLD